jgi:signal transduction histidine kinase
MEFVAGVSHELRTPLTVIHTAAYNLRGSVANHPKQVERYGEVIQRESARLTELVEQILQFASVRAGMVIRERAAVSVSQVIQAASLEVHAVMEQRGCVLEQSVDPFLPSVLGDSTGSNKPSRIC